MVSWYAAGGVTAFNPISFQPNPEGVLLNQAGSVDAQAVTRLQYNLDGVDDRINAVARLRVTATDIANNGIGTGGEGRRLGAVMVVVDAVHFPAGKVPTPAEIRDKGPLTMQWRSTEYRTSTIPGDYEFHMAGPRASQLQPNAKYWVMVVPSTWVPGTTSNYLNNRAIALGAENSIARAVSVWANRSPKAPVITSPVSGSVVPGGNTVPFTFEPADPDRVVGGSNQSYTDLAGVQVQYAPRASATNPNPQWTDLPWASVYGPLLLGSGWWIDGAASQEGANFDRNSGMQALWSNRTAPLKCGSNTLTAGAGQLPSGDWQIRMRTYDYGHPYPGLRKAFGSVDGNITPANAPATNTSPWSAPVNVSVSAQVPPPIPVSPTNNSAISDNLPVTLQWRYRNTASQSYPQANRLVQIRKSGVAAWTTLVNQASSSTGVVVDETAFPLEPTTQYEWRVQVTDSTGYVSNFSETARFWIVPAPQSGSTRPLPTGSIEGATLGCGKHTIDIYRRGGKRHVGTLSGVVSLDYARVRDDMSDAKIVVREDSPDCGRLLSRLKTLAYEVRITRDNGYSQDRVWEGPITLLTFDEARGEVTIQAKDVMFFLYRRNIRAAMNEKGSGDSVVSRAVRLIQNGLAPDDPNVLAYLTVFARSDDAKTGYRSTPAYSRTVFEEVDDMAANSGLDYTALGRSIIVWDTHNKIGTLPEFKSENFGSPPVVSEYGMQMANVYAVSDGNGVYGVAAHRDSGLRVEQGDVVGDDEDYGLVEMLSSTWAQDAETDTGTYSQEALATTAKTFTTYAERSVADRYPPPVIVRVPDNTTLNPDTLINIQQLVPGVTIPLRSIGRWRKVVALQKLDSVRVVEVDGKETISVTMSPFNGDDAVQEVTE